MKQHLPKIKETLKNKLSLDDDNFVYIKQTKNTNYRYGSRVRIRAGIDNVYAISYFNQMFILTSHKPDKYDRYELDELDEVISIIINIEQTEILN